MLKQILIIAVILLSVLFCVQDSSAITIGPGRLETRLPPGEVADIDYYAQNETDAPIHVVVEPENWAKGSYDYGDLSIKDWVTVDCYEFDLQPREIKKLKLTVRVPKTAKGELVTQIFFTSSAAGSSAGSVRARLGAVLYVAVTGTEKVGGGIRAMDAIDMSDKIKINVTMFNDGNVHLRAREGSVLIEDQKGQRVALLNMVTDPAVLPGQERTYSVLVDKSLLKEGAYSVSSDIKYGKMYGREKTASIKKVLEVGKDGKVTVR